MSYVKVPRGLIEEKSIGDKRVLIYLAAVFSNCEENSIDGLVKDCGYSLDRHAGTVLSQFDDVIGQLMGKGFLQLADGRMTCGGTNDCFGIVYRDEFDRILRARDAHRRTERRVNPAHTLLLLSCVRCYMLRTGIAPHYSNLLKRISENIGISVRSISGCVRTLEDLDILHSEELPRYKDENGLWHSNVRIFVNRQSHGGNLSREYDWQAVTKRGIEMILRSQVN